MLLLKYICILAIFLLTQVSLSQDAYQENQQQASGMKQKSMSLPFRTVNNLILIPVQINDSDTLQFIFDTGLENSIICELDWKPE
jgi:hypothetical protein